MSDQWRYHTRHTELSRLIAYKAPINAPSYMTRVLQQQWDPLVLEGRVEYAEGGGSKARTDF